MSNVAALPDALIVEGQSASNIAMRMGLDISASLASVGSFAESLCRILSM